MDVAFLERFVTQTAQDSGHAFTLDGESVAAKDLGDPQCLLPLVMAAVQTVFGDANGIEVSPTRFLAPADPKTHMVGWEIISLPDVPEGALLLLTDYSVRCFLAEPPQAKLMLPKLHSYPTVTREKRELRPHLKLLGLQLKPVATQLNYHTIS